MTQRTYGSRYLRMDQVKFFKGFLPKILLGPFLDTLTHVGKAITNAFQRRVQNPVKHLR